MSIAHPYAGQLDFHGGRNITRWRPAIQWPLAILQLVIVSVRATCGTGRPRSPNAYPEQLNRWAPLLQVVPGHPAVLASATSWVSTALRCGWCPLPDCSPMRIRGCGSRPGRPAWLAAEHARRGPASDLV